MTESLCGGAESIATLYINDPSIKFLKMKREKKRNSHNNKKIVLRRSHTHLIAYDYVNAIFSFSLPPSSLISSATGNLVSYLAPHANVIHKTYRNTGSYTGIVFKNGLVDALLRVYSQKSPQVTWQNLSSFSLMAQFHETVAPLFIFNHFPVECPSFYSNFSHDMWSYISLYIYPDVLMLLFLWDWFPGVRLLTERVHIFLMLTDIDKLHFKKTAIIHKVIL